jgi:hypothetical protein
MKYNRKFYDWCIWNSKREGRETFEEIHKINPIEYKKQKWEIGLKNFWFAFAMGKEIKENNQ